MMDEIHITYNEGKGHMVINCNNFFPSSQNKLKQLLNIINLDCEHRSSLLQELVRFLEDKIAEGESQMSSLKKDYAGKYQEKCDLKLLTETCKHANGLPLTRVELKEASSDYKKKVKEVKQIEEVFKRIKKNVQRLKVNLEIVQERF